MSNCFDVAKYILTKNGQLTAMKLQKLVYYSQAWSLVWDEAPLFEESIEAWMNGPVIPSLYNLHSGKYYVTSNDIAIGNESNLTNNQKDTIDHVLEYYGDKSSKWLSDLTHMEEPWINARNGLSPAERGNREITKSAMAEYYTSIMSEETK